jgi:uncharacterized protein
VIRAVLDANILVSAFPRKGGTPAELINRWLNREFLLIVSEHILACVARAWNKPWFQQRFSHEEAHRVISALRSEAAVVVPAPGIHGVAVDTEDDLVLATAVAGEADYLVTGDRRLREIGQYRSVIIRTPAEFVAVLRAVD